MTILSINFRGLRRKEESQTPTRAQTRIGESGKAACLAHEHPLGNDEDTATVSVSSGLSSDSEDLAVPKPRFSFRTMGGAFCSTLMRSPCLVLDGAKDDSSDNSGGEAQPMLKSKPTKNKWKSSQIPGYHRHSPPASPPTANTLGYESDHSTDTQLILKRQPRKRDLPDCWYFSSNHVLINRERSKRDIRSLVRCSKIDALAREHATYMARKGDVRFAKRIAVDGPSRRIGQNVASGTSIREIHIGMMTRSKGDKNNILDTRYSKFGMGTAKGPDGRLYLCQIFRG